MWLFSSQQILADYFYLLFDKGLNPLFFCRAIQYNRMQQVYHLKLTFSGFIYTKEHREKRWEDHRLFRSNRPPKLPIWTIFGLLYVIFHKFEVQKDLTSLNLNWFKSYDTKPKCSLVGVVTGGPHISWFLVPKGNWSWNAGIMNSEDCF